MRATKTIQEKLHLDLRRRCIAEVFRFSGRYFNDPAIDNLNKHLLTFAAYNAGPKKILDLRDEAENRGLDPNVWFKNVELVVAEKVGRETVQYVSNIYKYYIAYKLTQEKAEKAQQNS